MAEKVLFVHAYPGDVAVSAGATLATLADRGASVTVLTCLRGESHEHGLAATDDRELGAALAVLGVTDHLYLGSPGARWEGREEHRYDTITSSDPGEVAADIAAALIALQPDVVVSYGPDGGDGHPDRIAVHDATRTAASVMGVPLYVMGTSKRTSGVRVEGASVADRKRRAIEAYGGERPSQPIDAPENFYRLRPPGNSFADFGLGAQILTCVLALLLGAFVGATLTVAHQASVVILGARIPWGIVVALVITAALVVGLRMVFETRLVAGIAALGLLGTSALLAVQSSGGSILVPDNAVGYVWTFGPVLIAGVALAWPQVRRRSGSNIKETSAKGSVS